VALAWSPDGKLLVVGTKGGEIHFVQLIYLPIGPPIVTPFAPPDCAPAIGCPICRRWSEIDAETLGGEYSCPQCAERLKVNQAAASSDWRPLADAWRLPVVSAWRRRRSIFSRRSEDTLQIGCLWCRVWLPVDASALGTEIDSLCCGRRVKISPSVINADWRPIAKAWSGNNNKNNHEGRSEGS
jgi:hypothetical protein